MDLSTDKYTNNSIFLVCVCVSVFVSVYIYVWGRGWSTHACTEARDQQWLSYSVAFHLHF